MIIPIGIDVSKSKLDIYVGNKLTTINNDECSIKKRFSAVSTSSRVVMEATGKYHRLAHRMLTQLGFSVMVINPYQSRHFARAMNVICKTDKVDAKILALFAEKMEFKPLACASQEELNLQDLSRHLDDLQKIKNEVGSRHKDSDGFIADSLQQLLDKIVKEMKETEKKLEESVNQDKHLSEKMNLLVTIPGIGKKLAISLISLMKELGTLTKREAAALSGLAPINNDSGTMQGRRRIRGGRHDIRSHMYMPVVGAATIHNKRLIQFYNHLVDAGKPKKVALTACMRKLIVWANAILANKQPWNEHSC